MGEVFKTWRRKVGILMVVVGLASMVGWVRSLSTVDLITVYYANSNCIFVSGGERFLFVLGDNQVQSETNDRDEGVEYRIVKWRDATKKLTMHWHSLNASKVKVYLSLKKEPETTMYSYWSITIPLTLVSLWLLISKPRSSTSKKIVEPISVEGT